MKKLFSSVEHAVIVIGILAATLLVAYLVNWFFKRLIKKSTEEMKNDPTNYQFLRHAVTAIIYLVGIGVAIFYIPNLKALASSLLAGAGILAVAVGFASQHALGNIISGVFIVIFKPFRVNDRVRLRELSGIIEDITLRHTVIRDFENRRIIIPNSLMSEEIIVNSDFGENKICKWIDIGISYDSDVDKAKEIMREEILNHPLHVDVRAEDQMNEDPAPVRVISLGDSSVNLRGWAWSRDSGDAFLMTCDLLESIKKRFDKEGIEIPFPHRTLVYKQNSDSSKVD
jgi:small conductance mechanosensitive channel